MPVLVLSRRDQQILRLAQKLKEQRNRLWGVMETLKELAGNALSRGNAGRAELTDALTAIRKASGKCCSKMDKEAVRVDMAFSRMGLPINAILPGRATRRRRARQ